MPVRRRLRLSSFQIILLGFLVVILLGAALLMLPAATEEGRIQIHREVELLGDVIDEALRHVDRHSAEHTIAVRNEHELLLVKIDARLIVQVLINLVNNAVKYTPQGSAIQIVTEKQGHTARVSVIDDGPGVPEAEQERVFEMFYR